MFLRKLMDRTGIAYYSWENITTIYALREIAKGVVEGLVKELAIRCDSFPINSLTHTKSQYMLYLNI